MADSYKSRCAPGCSDARMTVRYKRLGRTGSRVSEFDDHRGTARARLAMTSMAPQGGRNA